MDYIETTSAAITKIGRKIKHRKGGIYEIVGDCQVQINGVWVDGIIYKSDGNIFVRSVYDCIKFELL